MTVTAALGSITDSSAITVGSGASFTATGTGGGVDLDDDLNTVTSLAIDTVGSFAVTGDGATPLTD